LRPRNLRSSYETTLWYCLLPDRLYCRSRILPRMGGILLHIIGSFHKLFTTSCTRLALTPIVCQALEFMAGEISTNRVLAPFLETLFPPQFSEQINFSHDLLSMCPVEKKFGKLEKPTIRFIALWGPNMRFSSGFSCQGQHLASKQSETDLPIYINVRLRGFSYWDILGNLRAFIIHMWNLTQLLKNSRNCGFWTHWITYLFKINARCQLKVTDRVTAGEERFRSR
jgi:hypothetical protein